MYLNVKSDRQIASFNTTKWGHQKTSQEYVKPNIMLKKFVKQFTHGSTKNICAIPPLSSVKVTTMARI